MRAVCCAWAELCAEHVLDELLDEVVQVCHAPVPPAALPTPISSQMADPCNAQWQHKAWQGALRSAHAGGQCTFITLIASAGRQTGAGHAEMAAGGEPANEMVGEVVLGIALDGAIRSLLCFFRQRQHGPGLAVELCQPALADALCRKCKRQGAVSCLSSLRQSDCFLVAPASCHTRPCCMCTAECVMPCCRYSVHVTGLMFSTATAPKPCQIAKHATKRSHRLMSVFCMFNRYV